MTSYVSGFQLYERSFRVSWEEYRECWFANIDIRCFFISAALNTMFCYLVQQQNSPHSTALLKRDIQRQLFFSPLVLSWCIQIVMHLNIPNTSSHWHKLRCICEGTPLLCSEPSNRWDEAIFNTLRTGAFKFFKCTFPGSKQF